MSYDHPLFEEEVFIPPVPFLQYFKEQHSKHVYWQCPAWKNLHKNSYVFFSQLDIKISYNKQSGIVNEESFNYCNFDEAASARYEGPGKLPRLSQYHGVAIGQLVQHLVFWPENSKNKNLWLEILPVPDMIKTHNAELIGGEYPFSRWFRPSLFAFKFHNQETVIKRGEPLGIIKFKNLNDYTETINLSRADIPDNIIRKALNHTKLKIFLPTVSWGLIKNAPTSKCPFKNFWKR